MRTTAYVVRMLFIEKNRYSPRDSGRRELLAKLMELARIAPNDYRKIVQILELNSLSVVAGTRTSFHR